MYVCVGSGGFADFEGAFGGGNTFQPPATKQQGTIIHSVWF